MKNAKIVAALLCAVMTACTVVRAEKAGEQALDERTAPFEGVDWYLTEIRTPETTVTLDRDMLNAEGLGDAYSLHLEDDHVFGTAAPNRYSAPGSWEGGFTIAIEPAVVTQMAPNKEIPLNEGYFFDNLAQVRHWAQPDADRLELYTYPDLYGFRTVLRFEAKSGG